jgi:hypothetical protein
MVEANAGFERVGRSFWADAKLGDRHLRLFTSMTHVGEVGAVFARNLCAMPCRVSPQAGAAGCRCSKYAGSPP